MCGRYTLTHDPDAIADAFDAIRESGFERSFNLCPTQLAPVVGLRDGMRVLRCFRWGLVPSWSRDTSSAAKCVNARSETAAEKPSFRVPFRRRRCLVPADGFFEWLPSPTGKVPHHFHRRDRALVAFAGLWDEWKGPGGPLRTFCVVTVPPNALVTPIHDRMPAVLSPEAQAAWLAPDTPPEALQALLVPWDPAAWECYPVDRRVRSTSFNEPACVEPVGALTTDGATAPASRARRPAEASTTRELFPRSGGSAPPARPGG